MLGLASNRDSESMARTFTILATLAVAFGAGAQAQTSKAPGAPIRVILDEPSNAPKAAPPPAKAQQPAVPPRAATATPAPAKTAAPAPRATEPKAATAPAAVRKATPRAVAPVRTASAARPEPKSTPRAKPKKMPPFPGGPAAGKPETYRREIEAWRDKLEEQRVAWGGGTYPEYRRALRTYQRGVDRYLAAIGRPRAPGTAPTYPAPSAKRGEVEVKAAE
jgi:hypothetical protein